MNKRIYIFLLFLISVFIVSCTCNRKEKVAKKEIEVKTTDVKVDIRRFEKDLFACHPAQLEADLAALQTEYPLFYEVFFRDVLNIQAAGDKQAQLAVISDFISKKAMRGLYDTVQQRFPNMDFLQKDLQVAFANYKSYFPEKPAPAVITCISEFSYSVFTVSDSIVGISLDKYLGKDYIYYPSVFPEYTFMLPTFDARYMAIDVANVLLANLVEAPDNKSTLLDKMVAEGKILYAMQSLLPDKKEQDIIKYNDKQWKWCRDNETQIWSFFLEQKLLYDTRFEQFKYVKDGPSTYGMPGDSPGKVGAWLGWQIVNAYMQKNPDTTLKALFAIKDGQKILTGSQYKPKGK